MWKKVISVISIKHAVEFVISITPVRPGGSRRNIAKLPELLQGAKAYQPR
jgi:hypothetical protein